MNLCETPLPNHFFDVKLLVEGVLNGLVTKDGPPTVEKGEAVCVDFGAVPIAIKLEAIFWERLVLLRRATLLAIDKDHTSVFEGHELCCRLIFRILETVRN